ncbi:MAG: adenylate/guanylate cyclase domain-containing protein, partial [Candidatus Eisenbacteria bacterium]
DIYALGAVMFFAVTGRNPPDAIARMKGDALENLLAPAMPQYGQELVDAISWAMKVDEKQRPQTVGEWRETIFGRVPVGMSTVPGLASAPATMRVTGPVENSSTDTQDISNLLQQREDLERAVKDKFQRVLTVMFTDLKGSTAIAETSGDLAVRAMLKRYHDLCEAAIKANGGTLVKTIGDGSLSHFTDALAGCRAAAAIQRAMEQLNVSKVYKTLLLARIGLHTGECILEKNDVFGDVVNTASRFEAAAKPGEILVSEDTYNALSSKTEYYARFDREVSLKGKSMPFKAYIVFWDPKEIEIDRARPAGPAKASTPAWKIAAWLGVPLLAILAAAFYITAGGKIGGESTRSINYSVPSK